jgi:hypothetical protein
MVVETGVVTVIVVEGVVVLRQRQRRLAVGALPSVAKTWRRWAVELVVAGLLQLDDRRRAASRERCGVGATLCGGDTSPTYL